MYQIYERIFRIDLPYCFTIQINISILTFHCEKINGKWKKLLNNLTKSRAVSVKRYLFLNPANDRDTVELHGFCGSFSKAYSVVIYICEISKSKQVHTTLYSAKY